MIVYNSVKQIWLYLSPKRKKQLVFLFILMIITSIVEVVSIGSIIPFLSAISNPEVIYKNELFSPYIQLLGVSSHKEILLPLTVIFIVATIFSGLMRFGLLWALTKISHAIGADLGFDFYQFSLLQGYEEHKASNSSRVISALSTKVNQIVNQAIRPALVLISSFFIIVAISTFLIYLNPSVALSVLIGFLIIYFCITLLTRNILIKNGKIINMQSNKIVKLVQEGLGGIRYVILDNLFHLYENSFRHEDIKLRRAMGNNQILNQSPRFFIESLGMILIAVIAYSMQGDASDLSNTISVLGAFAISAQRVLPLLQQSFSSWSYIYGSQGVLEDVMSFVKNSLNKNQQIKDSKILFFKQSIKLNNLSFTYKTNCTKILNKINIEIRKGEKVGFIGETGCGKSTLLDIVMFLLHPVEGSISVDDVKIDSDNQNEWQAHIAHIPQNIFLIDDTITRNIAFGLSDDQIDHSAVASAARQAGISKTIESLDLKYESIVGERGNKLSGGQLQRIGIARALYKKSDVIILDEATSALDEKTENSIINNLYTMNKNITIIMVSHRLSAMKNCDVIYEIEHGEVKWSGAYADLNKR